MASKGYSAKTEIILAALLTTTTIQEACKVSGVPERTIYRYLSKEDFKKKYQAARIELITRVTYKLQSTLSEAADVLQDILNDATQNGQIRISAARTILEYGHKFTEQLDVVERLEALEGQIEAEGGSD